MKPTSCLLAALCSCGLWSGCLPFRSLRPVPPIRTWACYYGSDPAELARLEQYDLVVMEPNVTGFVPPAHSATLYAGYLSVGEAETYRWYWDAVRDSSFILRKNENWADNYLADIRSRTWQNILLRHIQQEIVNKGYRGVFFDTIDMPLFLEEEDPAGFAGSTRALAAFIRRVRREFPHLYLVSNNGLRAMKRIGKHIDILVLESLNTTYDFAGGTYGKADAPWREKRLELYRAAGRKVRGKPVLVIDYLPAGRSDLLAFSNSECRRLGFIPFHTTVELTSLPAPGDYAPLP